MTICSLVVLLFHFEPICCSVYGSNCCSLTCLQIFQEIGKVVWYSHLLKNFPQFVVIHTAKACSIVSEAEVVVFLKLPCFLHDLNKCCQFDLWFVYLFETQLVYLIHSHTTEA